jgi:DNA gyrase/topoisomerase IV subunit B/DNA gyrase/topoisomerase IV subunit A
MSKELKNQSNNTYNASDIDVYEGLLAIRKRPEMYIGSRGPQGLHHLVWEVVDNSVDEHLAKHCSLIDVTINQNGSITVTDNGRGMPVDNHPKFNRPAIEILVTVPHAGGKFGGNGYSVSGGLHGVGIKAVNALSKLFSVKVKRNNKEYDISYKYGELSKALSEKKGVKDETGTSVTFIPDEKIFRETVDFDRKTIAERLHESSFLNPGLRIKFQDLREELPYSKEYYSTDGILELLEIKTAKLKTYTKDVFNIETTREVERLNPDSGEKETVEGFVKVVFKYTNSDNDNYYSYVNNIKTKDGEHVKGFRNAILKSFNTTARELKFIKEKEKDIRDRDILSGIVSIIYVRIPEPRFEGQTKESLTSKEANELVFNSVYDEALKYFKKNKNLVKELVEFSREQEKMREELKATKDTTQDNSLLTNGSLPGKLADCSSDNIEENELFIVEGDSAGGSAKQGRDREFQAILALRGKVLNVQGEKVKKVLDNKEIQSIITSLGCGVKDLCDPNKARYGKIIILTDADVDGAHIQSLLLTFFFWYLRPYVDAGRLFIAKPPLFKVKFKYDVKKLKKDQEIYLYNDLELRDLVHGLPDNSFEVQRYKGLGEMNAEQLWETTLDPTIRKLEQVILPDVIKAEGQFETFMGGNNGDKVDFIRKVIKAYKMRKNHISHVEDIEELAELDLSDDELSKEIEKNLSIFKNINEKNTALRVMTDILKESIGDYAYYVNIKRNIPDIRDGLKPVQRRIVWAMHKEKMNHDKPYKKCARVVGEVIGKYHPHGDSAVYESLVKLAQPFHENSPILDFHGNVGSVDGDNAAAMRYTETRLNHAAEDMVEYIDYNTTEFEDNFSREYKEPLYLPGKFPYVLVNGTQGVGVSVSTNIPAHNINEVLNAIKHVIDNPNATVKDLMKFIKGPDFPTGGILIDNDLQSVYETGNGGYKVRAKIHTEVIKGKQALVITEIPYNINKDAIIRKVSECVQDQKDGNKITLKKISDIVDYKDESDRKSMRLIFFLKKTANAESVKKELYKYTQLETSYKVNLLAIENEEIKIFTLKGMIDSYINHRQIVLTRKFEYELEAAEKRKHLVEGYLKILKPASNLDKAIDIIRSSADSSVAKTKLMKEFTLSDVQAQYILDRRLSTLSRADVKKYEEELKNLKAQIKELQTILGDINEINKVIKLEIDDMAKKYQIKRKTEIVKAEKIEESDKKSEEVKNAVDIYVGIDVKMKFKKVNADVHPTIAQSSQKNVPLIYSAKTDSSQKMLGLTNNNFIIQSTLEHLPYSTEKNKNGEPYDLKKELKANGRIDTLKINYLNKQSVLLLFENGEIEKMPITYFQSSEYNYEAKILDFIFVNEDDKILITSKQGQLIVIEVSQFKEGKKQLSINLENKDAILSLDYYDENGYLLVVTTNNFVNLVPMNEFTPQSRGGKGIRYFKQGSKTGTPIISVVFNDIGQKLYIETDKKSEVQTLSTFAEISTRTVIGKQSVEKIKTIIPLLGNVI